MSKAELINEDLAEPLNVKELFDKALDGTLASTSSINYRDVERAYRECAPEQICLVVRVTPEDIEQGTRKNSQRCPIARAFARLCEDNGIPIRYLGVGAEQAQVEAPWGAHSMNLPAIAKSFVRQYDAHGPGAVRPIEFTLDPRFEDFLLRGSRHRIRSPKHMFNTDMSKHAMFNTVAA